MTVGERIREARKNIPMNQEDLGRLLGIGKSSVSEWESNKRPIPMDTIEEIAKILHVTVPYLMGWETKGAGVVYEKLELSSAAITLARKYDSLDDYSKKIVESVVDLELNRPNTSTGEQ